MADYDAETSDVMPLLTHDGLAKHVCARRWRAGHQTRGKSTPSRGHAVPRCSTYGPTVGASLGDSRTSARCRRGQDRVTDACANARRVAEMCETCANGNSMREARAAAATIRLADLTGAEAALAFETLTTQQRRERRPQARRCRIHQRCNDSPHVRACGTHSCDHGLGLA